MSDTPELTTLTIKDLRQMAGEHQIQNASRMGKERLLGLLQGVIAARAADGLAAQPALQAEASAAASSGGPRLVASPANEPEVITVEGVASASPAAVTDADEPEVLDAATVSALTGDSQPAKPAAAPGDLAAGEGAPGEGAPGEGEPRRRRRRRRRRGGGRGDGQQGGEQGQGGTAGEQDEDGDDDGADAAPAAATPTAADAPAAVAPDDAVTAAAPIQPVREPRADRPRNDQRGEPRNDRRNEQRGERPAGRDLEHRQDGGSEQRLSEARPADGRNQADSRSASDNRGNADNRAPRPRLNGPQRPVSSVLDRLSVFTRGVLELCDPSTPSWAQPRLAELLSEAGVVPMPSQGTPHPDYHRVLGTVTTTVVPAGHICEITAPGFALRGDRGDLFCLRKADVKLAGDRTEDATHGSSRAPSARPEREPRVDQGATADPQPTEAVDAPIAEAAPRNERRDGGRGRGDRGEQRREPQPPREGGFRPRGAERRPEAGELPVADATAEQAPLADVRDPEITSITNEAPVADAPVIEAPAAEAPVADEHQPVRPPMPSPGRSPERTHPRESATTAQPLPLTHLATEELAAKPKAEAFRALGLNDQILADLAEMGWKEPAPIQAAAIPVALAGKDLIGQAQTGTGKTAGFVLPTLQKLYALDGEGPVALMLCPTRELAKQVHAEFVRMAGTSAARCALIYGGVPMEDQFRALQRKPHVIIGTPGRVIDHMKRKTLDLSRLSTIVLDEADQMLDIGFWPDVTYIMSHTPPDRQVLLFSATFPEQVKELAEKHMREPVRIQIEPEQVTVGNVDQKYIAVPRERKNELLAHFIETFNPPQMVVFCKTKHQTDRVAEVLKRKHMSAGAIHGDLPQSKREKTLQAFRAGELQCLVATNVAARGLDIPSVSHVVNFDVPETPEEYVHRIGRTARNGASGVARTFITSEDGQFLLEIEKHIGLLLEEEQVEGFTLAPVTAPTRTIADQAVGTPRLLKPLIGGIRLGRRR